MLTSDLALRSRYINGGPLDVSFRRLDLRTHFPSLTKAISYTFTSRSLSPYREAPIPAPDFPSSTSLKRNFFRSAATPPRSFETLALPTGIRYTLCMKVISQRSVSRERERGIRTAFDFTEQLLSVTHRPTPGTRLASITLPVIPRPTEEHPLHSTLTQAQGDTTTTISTTHRGSNTSSNNQKILGGY